MLTLDLKPLVALKGEQKVVPYLVAHGMTVSRARMVEGGDKVRMMRDDTVRELCEILDCMPNDLFRWNGASEHRLAVLNRAPLRRLEDVMMGKDHADLAMIWAELQARDSEKVAQPRVRGGRVWLNVRRLMEMRSVSHPAKTLQRFGFSEMVARKLTDIARRDGDTYLKMPLLIRLCEKLDCFPNDLYDFEGPQGHVLDGLRKTPLERIADLLKRMTAEEARRLLGNQ